MQNCEDGKEETAVLSLRNTFTFLPCVRQPFILDDGTSVEYVKEMWCIIIHVLHRGEESIWDNYI